jgi:hypothetical protein
VKFAASLLVPSNLPPQSVPAAQKSTLVKGVCSRGILASNNKQESDMEKLQPKLMEGDIQETYSESLLRKAWSKYSFEFKVDGVVCRVWYDQQEGLCAKCSDTGAELLHVAEQVEEIIRESKCNLDRPQVRQVLCKHLRAMIKVERELQRAPASERRFKLLNAKPLDKNGMSLEDQCLLEVLQEQSEKVNQAAAANGTPDDVKYEVTAEMVAAKMQGKTR